jgi:hypothetical protein
VTSPHDPVGSGADQPARHPDDIEDWVTDLRANLDDDPPGWLVAADDTDEQDPEPSRPDERPKRRHGAPAAASTQNNDPQRPAIGRHRAAE